MESILLIDDDSTCNFLATKLLERIGYQGAIYTALNGLEGLLWLKEKNLAKETLPNVILVDLNMPVLNGFEFLTEFQKLPFPDKENTKLIVVSSSIEDRDVKKSRELGATDFVSKPLGTGTLAYAVGID